MGYRSYNNTLLCFIIGTLLLAAGCDDVFNNQEDNVTVPQVGENPLPGITGTAYKIQKIPNPKGDHLLSNDASEVKWEAVNPLLKKVQYQTGSRYAAIYSVRDSSKGQYFYRTSPLQFSPEALKAANGDIRGYVFEESASDNKNSPVQLLVAYIPDSKQAAREMREWILSKTGDSASAVNMRSKKDSEEHRMQETCYHVYKFYDEKTNILTIYIEETECVTVTSGGGSSGGGSGVAGDKSCPEQLLPPPECSDGDEDLNPPPPFGGGGYLDDGETKTLQEALEENEYLLLDVPCEEIPEWAGLSQHIPPQSVISKLEDEYYGDIDILSIQDAAGTVVNMDYFSVNVSSLPSGMSTSDLLSEIRMSNINNFIDTDLASFSPYDKIGYPYDEAAVWHSSNPLGAVLSIDIALPVDDGSVVVSDFNSGSWTFSTVSDPWNFDHPVSGNRMFGFLQNDDGSYTFFTRGVDRITRKIDNIVAQNFLDDPFKDPDALWTSFQQKLKDYINQNGGNATANNSVTYRPNWDEVFDVLNGQANSTSLGCTQ